MKRLLTIIILLLPAIILLAGCSVSGDKVSQTAAADTEGQSVTVSQKQVINGRAFISENELNQALAEINTTADDDKPLKMLVVPHHTVAASLSAQAIALLVEQQPQTVIIIGPNHSNRGAEASTTKADWQTYNGLLKANQTAIDAMLDGGLVKENNSLFAGEHSIGLVTDIVAAYLPDAQIVPLALQHGYDIDHIAAILDTIDADNCVIIASIDFSHNLTQNEAEQKDRQMRSFLEQGNYQTIANLDSEYIDAPTIMAYLLKVAQEQQLDLEILNNDNSGQILGDSELVTSYFTIAFY